MKAPDDFFILDNEVRCPENLITAVWMNISARLRRFRARPIRASISSITNLAF